MFIETNEIKIKYADSERSKESYLRNIQDSKTRLEKLNEEFLKYKEKIGKLGLDVNQIMRDAEDWNNREKYASLLRMKIKDLEEKLSLWRREMNTLQKHFSSRTEQYKYYEKLFLTDKDIRENTKKIKKN